MALGLAGCASFGSAGEPAGGFITTEVANAYLPLEGPAYLVLEGHGAGVVIEPGIAVTNAHNANLVDANAIIGTSRDYDLMFFRTASAVTLATAEPQADQRVIAYGQGSDGGLRMANGVVRWLDAPVLARCETCQIQHAFAFEADAGKGFSGGPVVDAADGTLLGIVFGYREVDGQRLMYAYDMKLVRTEMSVLQGR